MFFSLSTPAHACSSPLSRTPSPSPLGSCAKGQWLKLFQQKTLPSNLRLGFRCIYPWPSPLRWPQRPRHNTPQCAFKLTLDASSVSLMPSSQVCPQHSQIWAQRAFNLQACPRHPQVKRAFNALKRGPNVPSSTPSMHLKTQPQHTFKRVLNTLKCGPSASSSVPSMPSNA